MAEHKKIYGRFATNPFENEKIKKQNIEAFSNLKGFFLIFKKQRLIVKKIYKNFNYKL